MRRPGKVGLFGLLGSGNLGNDASLAAVIGFLRTHYPDARLEAMCAGPDSVTARFGIPSVPLHSYRHSDHHRYPLPAKVWGKVRDTVRTAIWVSRCDVVIVPGMGVLETVLPARPWGWPWNLFVLSASGRLLGTRVAMIGVGASPIRPGLTRRLVVGAARLAHQRSYRDQYSKDALAAMGINATVS